MAPMAGSGRWAEAYYVRGSIEIRSTLHLSLRLGVRLNQLLQHTGGASAGTGLWRAALPLFVVLDIVSWRRLRRSDNFGLAWRLPLDAADVAFWTASPLPIGGHDWAVLIAIPIGIEAGVRLGWRGVAVPVAIFLPSVVTAAVFDRAPGVMGFGWITLSVVMGVAFFRYCRHLDRRAEAQQAAVRAARRRRAYLAGQNRVAMGASSAVDAIEGLVPVLGRPAPGSALWQLADGWKTQLSESTAQEARYLQVVLLEWERARNRHPDLSALVELRIDEGDGTTLLTATQVGQLERILDDLALRGPVAVRLRDTGAPRLPGQDLPLVVDGRLVTVPADRRAAAPPIDPCASTYLYLATLCLIGLIPAASGMPVPAALAGMATSAVVGIVSHDRIVRHGEAARVGVFALAILAGTVITALTAFARSPINREGDPMVGLSALLLLSFLGGFYWTSLRGWRWLVPASMAWVLALAVAVFPAPSAMNGRALLSAVIWNVFPFFPCRHLARALAGAGTRHAVAVRLGDEDAEQAAFTDGQEWVVGLVRQARDDALGQLRAMAPQLDRGIVELAGDRLEEVDRRLTATLSASASS